MTNPGAPLRFLVLGTVDLVGPDGEVRSILVQSKRLALFAYLVLARPAGFHRRDSLLALFWPESDTERARRALRQSLHFLRKALGAHVVVTRGDEELGIGGESLWCDAAAFVSAIDNGRWAEAYDLYRGDLLSGFYAADVSPEFQDWLERERTWLRARAASAAWQLSAAADRERNVVEAANWGRRAIGLAPDDEAGIRRFITLLDRLGDRAGALREHDEFATRLKREFDVEPAPETRVLMEEVRSRARAPELHDGDKPHPTNPALLVSGRTESASSAAASRSAGPPARTLAAKLNGSVRKWLVIGSSIGTLATIGLATFMLRARPETKPVLAVGSITNEAGAGAEETARLLPGLLATNLSRVAGLSVVSQPRLLETLVQLDSRDETTQALADAARRAGASEILEGVLYRRGTTLRLDLRRVDLRRRVVRESYSASGSDAFELTERATADIARAFALTAPATPLAASGSLVARRFYEQGLRAYYRGEWRGAYELFSATLGEDSTFAMAAYYAAHSIARFRTDSAFLLLEKAARLAERAPERERLTIRHARYPHAYASRAAYAESLAIRFPNEPSGHLAVAALRVATGDFMGAVPYAQRAIALDSISLQNKPPICYACDAYEILLKANASIGVDSFPAVERTARDWINRQPGSGAGWQALAGVLSWRGEKDAALDALSQAARHQPEATPAAIFWSAVIKGEDYREAERLLRNRLRFDERDGEALWWLVVTLRHQGRASEALALARRGRQGVSPANWEGVTMWAQMEAHQLYELERFQEAGLRFSALIQTGPHAPADPEYAAWRLSWDGMHAATAWAAAGDTLRLQQLADTIARVAGRTASGLAWHAAPYVRGLLWQARGQPARAAEEFRSAIFSPTLGYTRTNYELARALLALGRAEEAVPFLQQALGGISPVAVVTGHGPGYYLTRTEIHEMIARAFESEQQIDSARIHYRNVVDAWENGDPPFRTRAEAARRKQHALR